MAQPPKVEKHGEWRRTRGLRTRHERRPGLCAGCHLWLSMQCRPDHSDDEYRSIRGHSQRHSACLKRAKPEVSRAYFSIGDAFDPVESAIALRYAATPERLRPGAAPRSGSRVPPPS
jgi:hypothetical protein